MSLSGRTINPTISVDCVIFGFSTHRLKVLLIERNYTNPSGRHIKDLKLPGDFISMNEDLDQAAYRTLEELTGLKDIFLQQFGVFGKPDRISKQVDMDWLLETTGLEIHRVVTTAYYSLINMSETNTESVIKNSASWIEVKEIPKLAFDHATIIQEGLKHLQHSLRNEPIGFELLPEKFTIRELQTLYEVILDCQLDNRNFRKKILKSSYVIQSDEKQTGVAHKPAYYYRFDKPRYEEQRKESPGFNF